MDILKGYTKLMNTLFNFIKIMLSIALFVMVFVTMLEVIRRYIFGLSFPWAEELVRFLLVISTFLGGAAAFRSNNLVNLDLLTSKFPKKVLTIVDIVNNTLIILFCCFIVFKSSSFTFSPIITKQFSTGLGLNMSYVYGSIPIGFSLLVLFALDKYQVLFKDLKEEMGKIEKKQVQMKKGESERG